MAFLDTEDGSTWWYTDKLCPSCAELITTNGIREVCPCGYSDSDQLKMRFSHDN